MSGIIDNDPGDSIGKVVLKNGSTMIFRPITREDTSGWLDFYQRLSADQECARLQTMPANIQGEDALRCCSIDYVNQYALVAEVREEGLKRIVGIGRFTRLPDPRTAEIFLNVLTPFQGNGIGDKMIEWLAAAALKQGIDFFETRVPAENTILLSIFQSYGFHMQQVLEGNVYRITFPLTNTPQVIEKKLERSSQATLKSLEYILKPRSVAVIGASNRLGAVGHLILQSLLMNGFKGSLYPINANYESVMSIKAYPSILNAPGDIDLAVIATPQSQILNIVDECGRKKVKGIIIVADGFREKDENGAILEREMVDIAFGYGMRIIGPNCNGVINTDPDINLNATFTMIHPAPGNISFVSQSGALGLGILQYAISLNIGFANFVSVGNRADIASTDLMQYWEKDPNTKVILLYLESFDNPEIFSKVSRRVSIQKPILAIKGGSTPEGSRATRSHTGAMATPSIISDALLQEAGIVAVNSISDLFDSAILLANQPVPRGRNTVIVSAGGGPGILTADACIRNGLKLPEISAETRAKIKAASTRDINIHNPVDLTAGVSAADFEAVLKILAEDPNYDSIITICIPPAGLEVSDVEEAVGKASEIIRTNHKPLLACFVGMKQSKGKIAYASFIPYYLFPEEAALALSNAVKYSELKTRPIGTIPQFKDIEKEKAHQLINRILTGSSERPLWISNQDLNELFKYYGIEFAETRVADTPEKAVLEAENIGFPVVIKLNSATITHKTDVGGVVLDVRTTQQVKDAFSQIKNSLAKIGRQNEMQGVTIQRQINDGVEVIAGASEDILLGHVIMFGMGGILAELMKDTALRLSPLTDLKAKDLINSVKISRILNGYRGMPRYDIQSVEELLMRISALVTDIPQISEIDLNPVKVQVEGQGYQVIDARILVK
jgi:acetate---CoA ligase (ADP-forming)